MSGACEVKMCVFVSLAVRDLHLNRFLLHVPVWRLNVCPGAHKGQTLTATFPDWMDLLI